MSLPNAPIAFALTVSWAMAMAAATHAAEAPKPVPEEQPVSKADRDALVRGNAEFGLDLYARLRRGDGNVFLSPFSISTALAMTANGARGETARQMAEVLHLPDTPAQANPAFAALIRSLNPDGTRPSGYQLHTANALWGQRGYHFLPEFAATLRRSYGATFQEVDFYGAADAARRSINAWAEKQTAGKIRDLIAPRTLDAQTRLVLANAIYFKGDWSHPFRADLTKERDFHPAPAQNLRVPMMYRSGEYLYAEDEAVQVLELGYRGSTLGMAVILPRKADGLASVESSLSAGWLKERLGKLGYRKANVLLPRFRVESQFELGRTLGELGMTLPFGDRADFSGINGGKEPLWISAVIHKSYVDVNESGTEAAAATAVGVGATAAPAPEQPISFTADHPFLFLIRDQVTGNLLFLGRLVQPVG